VVAVSLLTCKHAELYPGLNTMAKEGGVPANFL
jgi:hypothetical protein